MDEEILIKFYERMYNSTLSKLCGAKTDADRSYWENRSNVYLGKYFSVTGIQIIYK